MERKIRVGAVSYLNTKPLVYGLQNGQMPENTELIFDYPAKVAALLLQDKIDVGLIPVAVISKMKSSFIITDFCIGTQGEVASVCLYSDVPLEEIQSIYLDYQSRTSAALLQVLLREHWKITPEIIPAFPGYETEIKGNKAGLVIGDRALIQRQKNKYIYDLGTAWKVMTGLPFVFAAWVANKELPAEFIQSFNVANETGLHHLEEISAGINFPAYDMLHYYTENIDYRLDALKRQGLTKFHSFLQNMQLVESR